MKKQYKYRFYLKPAEKSNILSIKDILEKNLSKRYTIKQLAKIALLNEFKLKNGFRLLFKTSIYSFHTELRIEKAKSMLKETDLLLLDIAFEIGYESVSSFIRAFKKIAGTTPATYRRGFLIE